jgi:putative DNA-invertase from lambdoid prophage Rac
VARTFTYLRVSTSGQTMENQLREIEAAGFALDKRRVVSDTISGSSAIEQRPGLMKLMDRLEWGDLLIVTKMDRLGRNAMDVTTTWIGSLSWACTSIASPSAAPISPALPAA